MLTLSASGVCWEPHFRPASDQASACLTFVIASLRYVDGRRISTRILAYIWGNRAERLAHVVREKRRCFASGELSVARDGRLELNADQVEFFEAREPQLPRSITVHLDND